MSLNLLSNDDTYRPITTNNLHGWETAVSEIKKQELYTVNSIKPQLADMYIGDFHGLLRELGTFPQYYHINCRINDLVSSDQFEGRTFDIKLVHEDVLEMLTQIITPHITTQII